MILRAHTRHWRQTAAGVSGRRGFSLVELLLAVFILGIGLIGISALFPAGIAQQRQATDDIVGPVVADSAVALLRSRVSPGQFGTFEDFGNAQIAFTNTGAQVGMQPTIQGDWGWRRPGFLFEDLQATDLINEAGAIDIFSSYYTLAQAGATVDGVSFGSLDLTAAAVEDADGAGGSTPLYGIPWNPLKGLPVVLFTQGERAYPQRLEGGGSTQVPVYSWECMFRRFAGRMQVAIFVYRLANSGGEPRQYTVAQGTGVAANIPPLPFLFDAGVAPFAGIRVGGLDGNLATLIDNAGVRTQNTTTTLGELVREHTWQAPGQVLVDQFGDVHRVSIGRRNTKDAANISLSRSIPQQLALPELFGLQQNGATVNGTANSSPGSRFIWFVPTFDSQSRPLRAVYATVQEL